MAQLDVEPKKNNDWWKWVLGILAAIIVIWIIVEFTGDDDDAMDDQLEPVAAVEYKTPSATPVIKV